MGRARCSNKRSGNNGSEEDVKEDHRASGDDARIGCSTRSDGLQTQKRKALKSAEIID